MFYAWTYKLIAALDRTRVNCVWHSYSYVWKRFAGRIWKLLNRISKFTFSEKPFEYRSHTREKWKFFHTNFFKTYCCKFRLGLCKSSSCALISIVWLSLDMCNQNFWKLINETIICSSKLGGFMYEFSKFLLTKESSGVESSVQRS